MASLLGDQDDLEGAVVAYRKAVQLAHDVYVTDVNNEFALQRLIGMHQALAMIFARKAELTDAIAHTQDVLRLRERWDLEHPSQYSGAAWQALFHGSLGDVHETIASRPRTPPLLQREHLARAREDYSRALVIWLSLAKKTPLEGEYAKTPEQLQNAITRCEQALSRLGRRPFPLASTSSR